MKIVAGTLLAGALAAGATLFSTGGRLASAPASSGGPPTHEHVASINMHSACGDDIDGPAVEATGFRGGSPDADGNLWGERWLRASDGRILRLSTCEHGALGLTLKEGPIAGRPVYYKPGGFGWPCGGTAMVGRPEVGEAADGIYESTGNQGTLIRTWKNKEQGGRWWFALVAGGGDAAAPRAKGQSADALGVKFGWINMPQVGLDSKLRFMAEGCFYLLEGGKVTCLLGPDDYKAATDAMKGSLPNEGYVGGDGSFYLGYYYTNGDAFNGKVPAVWRVAKDGKTEPWAQSHGHNAGDGDSLTQAGWFCGPHLGRSSAYRACRFIPADSVFTSAHDEDLFRRIQNRRVSTLCTDGEWREFPGNTKWKGALIAAGGVIAPGGTIYHSGRTWVDNRLWRYTGFDFSKPPVSKREGGK